MSYYSGAFDITAVSLNLSVQLELSTKRRTTLVIRFTWDELNKARNQDLSIYMQTVIAKRITAAYQTLDPEEGE